MQFEIENQISIMQMMKMMTPGNNNDREQYENLIKLLIGNEYEWKIGDMDHKLNGNINLDG